MIVHFVIKAPKLAHLQFYIFSVGGKDTERVEDGPDSADMEEERGCS